MAGEALLILEPDPAAEQYLNSALAEAGYQVYAADDLDSVLRALESSRFPLVMLDVGSVTMPIEQVTARIAALQPDTMVVFSGSGCTAEQIVSMMRGGAVDYVERPFDTAIVATRFGEVLRRRRQQRSRVKLWESRAKAAEQALEEARTGSGAKSDAMVQVGDFAEFALETVLAIERKNIEMERRLQASSSSMTAGADGPLRAWVAHSDAEFAAGVMSLGARLGVTFESAMTTGGEVLDKLSSEPPQLIVLDASLPDIPGEFLVSSIRAEYPDIQMVVIEGWGTEERAVVVTGGSMNDLSSSMAALGDLVAAMEKATQRARNATVGRDIAAGFKHRHEEFLRRFADMKKLIERVG